MVEISVRKLREELGMSRQEFADRFGFNLDTLRQWEYGRRHPTGPARLLLIVLSRAPDVVSDAVHAAASLR